MEVILREHVENLGRRGEVVKVAAGYARNYLLPRKLALLVNDQNRRQIERERKVADARELQERQDAEAVATKLAAVELVIARRVGEHDALYGSVTSADIAEALEGLGFHVEKRKIVLAEPIKQVGEFAVTVKIHHDVHGQITVKVVPLGTARPAAEAAAAPETPAQ
jgi:large subunit ribosomal protein L9